MKLKLKMKAATEEQSPKPKKARKSKTAPESEEEPVVKPRAPDVQLSPAEKLKKREKTSKQIQGYSNTLPLTLNSFVSSTPAPKGTHLA
jgi:hypothetical protein